MKLEGERWRTLVSTVRLGRDEYRVVRPAKPLKHAPLYDTYDGFRGVQLIVDKAAALELAMAWEFAMRSPRTLVYLPLRETEYDCRSFGVDDEPLLDLVLMHHSLGFPPSRWKEVRARLGRGRPHTVRSRGFPAVESLLTPDHQPLRRGYRDVVRHHFAADTLFLTGSWKSFALNGDQWRELIEDGPRRMHENPGEHFCTDIAVERIWDWMHVAYCHEHRVSANT
ncbi:hypothetical protein SAMN04488564_103998 [Lentzea waywayandensis]|uniref:Uncharacterized protein n=1 Tax=Lentzea waywayandensis TaxID=84724 RepID=A0A1I6E6I4_9PSEU|nr:hypothetical protein [Lentzea waywayandensis]SFR13343.1 hypothetical protein SAMN04488564_103998 [Lentzea waywayandensis]